MADITYNKKRVAVLISGSGSNLQALIDACNNEDYPAQICLVISNKADAFGVERAKKHNIPAKIISHKDFLSRNKFDEKIHKALVANNIELVCLAGFMRILTAEFVQKWQGKMINIHPSLLPKYKGATAIKDAFEAGEKKTGCTVHYVVPEIDSGEIISQREVKIEQNDSIESLTTKIHKEEHIAYVEALRKVC